jgi:hypothetical protein
VGSFPRGVRMSMFVDLISGFPPYTRLYFTWSAAVNGGIASESEAQIVFLPLFIRACGGRGGGGRGKFKNRGGDGGE